MTPVKTTVVNAPLRTYLNSSAGEYVCMGPISLAVGPDHLPEECCSGCAHATREVPSVHSKLVPVKSFWNDADRVGPGFICVHLGTSRLER
jgi:hypothetical protein